MEAHDDELVRRLAQLCGKPPHLIEHVIANRRSSEPQSSEADRRPIRTSSQSANAWVHAGRKSSQSSESGDRLSRTTVQFEAANNGGWQHISFDASTTYQVTKTV